jgi:hypothetical protein
VSNSAARIDNDTGLFCRCRQAQLILTAEQGTRRGYHSSFLKASNQHKIVPVEQSLQTVAAQNCAARSADPVLDDGQPGLHNFVHTSNQLKIESVDNEQASGWVRMARARNTGRRSMAATQLMSATHRRAPT